MNEGLDSKTSIAQLKYQVRDFCDARDWDQFHGPKDLAIGLSTEAAEILELVRFKTDAEFVQEFKQNPTELSDELADVLFFVLRMADRLNIDLSESFNRKMNKNAERYTVENSRGSNKKIPAVGVDPRLKKENGKVEES